MYTLRIIKSGWSLLLTCLLLVLAFSGQPHRMGASANTNAWPTVSISQVATDLNLPVHVTHAGDGSGRLFIVEQGGVIRIYQGGLQNTPFLDISDRVRSPLNANTSEEGLLSVAFPPAYASKGYFYVYYTNLNGDNQVSRFRITSDPDLADPDSEELILYLNHPVNSNHNGGQLFFGPKDGFLYIGTGDGGGGGDPLDNAENLSTLLGKILRIDVEDPRGSFVNRAYDLYLPLVSTVPALKYRVPAANPYVNTAGAHPEIWALGLRNPWRFSFDRLTGDLYIGDVGQNLYEEIDFQAFDSSGGENYGWDTLEADVCYEPLTGCVPPPNYSAPIFSYPHGGAAHIGVAVTGGYVYRGSSYPDMSGIYFLADYGNGNLWGLRQTGGVWEDNFFTMLDRQVMSFGEDEAGELYFTAKEPFADKLYRLQSAPPR